MITKTVKTINERIAGKMDDLKCLEGFQLYGLAEPVIRRYNDDEWIPLIVDSSSEDHEVFVDDDYPLGVYHRHLAKTYSTPEKKNQFGDDTVQNVVADMILVCWSFRRYLGDDGTVEALERLIYSCLPEKTIALQSNFDRRSVFSTEFQNVPFNLPEDVLLFSMRYRFIYPVNSRECIDIEDICNT